MNRNYGIRRTLKTSTRHQSSQRKRRSSTRSKIRQQLGARNTHLNRGIIILHHSIFNDTFTRRTTRHRQGADRSLTITRRRIATLTRNLSDGRRVNNIITRRTRIIQIVTSHKNGNAANSNRATRPTTASVLTSRTRTDKTVTINTLNLRQRTTTVTLGRRGTARTLNTLKTDRAHSDRAQSSVSGNLTQLGNVIGRIRQGLQRLGKNTRLVNGNHGLNRLK